MNGIIDDSSNNNLLEKVREVEHLIDCEELFRLMQWFFEGAIHFNCFFHLKGYDFCLTGTMGKTNGIIAVAEKSHGLEEKKR